MFKKKISKIKKHANSDEVIFIKKVTQHPRDRRMWQLKKMINQEDTDDNNILFVKKFLYIQK